MKPKRLRRLTDDLITDLSKISSMFIIARNSVLDYKGKNVAPEEVARDLGVRYVLDGSVRALSETIRINSRLTDTKTRVQIWAERFDRKMDDIFALQDDVTGRIIAALEIELTPEDKGRLRAADNITLPMSTIYIFAA